ncbi:hypothetical protein LTR33_013279 [Friedmanniomyces endolithicus]|nr:hypothetical protein LTR33_013279 [Friedmanniomyces endolithicus]
MKEVIVHKGPRVQIIDSEIPKPGPGQVVTKVVETSNLHARRPPVNQGDDISGIVHAVGANVSEFRPGDRVAAFHEMMKPGGSYAEYAFSWAYTTFRLPEKTTFEGEHQPSPVPFNRSPPPSAVLKVCEFMLTSPTPLPPQKAPPSP